MTEIDVKHADELADTQVAQVREIYFQAFEPHHRVPFAELAATGPADLMLAALEADQPVGFAALRLFKAACWTFLRYYGIAADRRGTGLGQRFWHQLRPSIEEVDWPGRIAFEVEDPAHLPSLDARKIAEARVAFWIRCGCQVLPVTGYVMPDFSGLAAPEPMLLMVSDPAASGAIGRGEIADLVRAIYAGRYQLGPDDPMVVAALASIGA